MQIRRFRMGDEPALFGVFFSAIHEIASRDYTQEQTNAWAPADLDRDAWSEHVRGLQPFVVELHDEIVGYADVQPNGYIDHFFVSGFHPRQGIGRLLMERIHQEAASLGLRELTSNVSRTAQPFFARHGFELVAQQTPIRRGVAIPNASMRKALPTAN